MFDHKCDRRHGYRWSDPIRGESLESVYQPMEALEFGESSRFCAFEFKARRDSGFLRSVYGNRTDRKIVAIPHRQTRLMDCGLVVDTQRIR